MIFSGIESIEIKQNDFRKTIIVAGAEEVCSGERQHIFKDNHKQSNCAQSDTPRSKPDNFVLMFQPSFKGGIDFHPRILASL